MMITVYVRFEVFQRLMVGAESIWVEERATSWLLLINTGGMHVYSEKMKSIEDAENFQFVEKFLTKPNVFKADKINIGYYVNV